MIVIGDRLSYCTRSMADNATLGEKSVDAVQEFHR